MLRDDPLNWSLYDLAAVTRQSTESFESRPEERLRPIGQKVCICQSVLARTLSRPVAC